MREINVVVTVYEHCYKDVRQGLATLGEVRRTEFFNVLAMRVAEPSVFPTALQQAMARAPELQRCVARAIPVTRSFVFQNAEEFEAQAREAVAPWVARLGGKRFHVRMHRRGFRGRLSSQDEERFLDHHLLEAIAAQGSPAAITFTDPDAIIVVETLGQWAGLSYWAREELNRYHFLKLD